MNRTWNIETTTHIGETVRVNGWVQNIRRMGDKLAFIDLRDGTGIVQVVCYKPDLDEATNKAVDELSSEYVVEIEGIVNKRGEKQVKADLPTGTVELGVKALRILNAAV